MVLPTGLPQDAREEDPMVKHRPLAWSLIVGLALVGWIRAPTAVGAATPPDDPASRPAPPRNANRASPPESPAALFTREQPRAPEQPETGPPEPAATLNAPPQSPVLNAPADGALVPLTVNLDVTVDDPDGDPLVVTFFGRSMERTVAPTLTLVALPDTQYYSCGIVCGSDPAIFAGQTQWIVEQAGRRQIRFVAHLGDIVEFGDAFAYEWQNADTAMSLLEPSLPPDYPDGMPYSLAVGNHDQLLGTVRFNQTFGVDRFVGRSYYGGYYGTGNNNHFVLFEAGGLDFIVISMEYAPSPDPGVLAWADQLLNVYSRRRAIILAHYLIDTGNPAPFGAQGEAIFHALQHHPNLFLMLSGHVAGEGRRQDTPHHSTVHTLLADYQDRPNGGDGWLRILELDPAENLLVVQTYSPFLDQYELDADSHFTLTVDLQHGVFQPIAAYTDVTPGSSVTTTWSPLQPGQAYEWYVTVSDGTDTTVGPVWHLATHENVLYTYLPVVVAGYGSSPAEGQPIGSGRPESLGVKLARAGEDLAK
jgi:hypothetical protein